MRLAIVLEHQEKNLGKSHEGDQKASLVIGLKRDLDPVIDIRIVREDHVLVSTMMIGEDIGNPEVELTKKMITKIEGHGRDMQMITKKGQLQNDRLLLWKNFPTVNRSVCLIMSDQLLFLPKRSSSQILVVQENSTVMNNLPQLRCSRMMTYGMTTLRRNPKKHRVKIPNMYLLHHPLQWQSKHPLPHPLWLENRTIPPPFQRMARQALNLPISLLHHQQLFLQGKKHHPKRAMIICSKPPWKIRNHPHQPLSPLHPSQLSP